MRIYWGKMLRRTRYSPRYKEHKSHFYVTIGAKTEKDEMRMFGNIGKGMRVKTYDALTLELLYEQLKADGHQIRGYKDVQDFSYLPDNAFEYVLIRDELKRRGNTDTEIDEMFCLDTANE